MYELSLVELESELAAELPTRNLLMCRHSVRRVVRKPVSHEGGTSANASFGSGANANSTDQANSNPQTVVNTGVVNGGERGGIDLDSFNKNSNHTTQTATPINFGVGN